MNVEGYTIKEMAGILTINADTVKQRLSVARIKPAIREAVYPKSALEAIRNASGRGRPKKPKPE
jgi:DNA-directed RNA polymerase specialized sigma24 family protein